MAATAGMTGVILPLPCRALFPLAETRFWPSILTDLEIPEEPNLCESLHAAQASALMCRAVHGLQRLMMLSKDLWSDQGSTRDSSPDSTGGRASRKSGKISRRDTLGSARKFAGGKDAPGAPIDGAALRVDEWPSPRGNASQVPPCPLPSINTLLGHADGNLPDCWYAQKWCLQMLCWMQTTYSHLVGLFLQPCMDTDRHAD